MNGRDSGPGLGGGLVFLGYAARAIGAASLSYAAADQPPLLARALEVLPAGRLFAHFPVALLERGAPDSPPADPAGAR